MAKLIAGMGTSHVPGLGAAMDNGKTQEVYWKSLFEVLSCSFVILTVKCFKIFLQFTLFGRPCMWGFDNIKVVNQSLCLINFHVF